MSMFEKDSKLLQKKTQNRLTKMLKGSIKYNILEYFVVIIDGNSVCVCECFYLFFFVRCIPFKE